MRIIADLQIHSKYSRACSQELVPKNIADWAAKKGIGIIGTGDFTHPGWLAMLKHELEEVRPGLFALSQAVGGRTPGSDVPLPLFMLTAEVSSIYKQGDKIRRVHNMIFAPSFEAVDRLVHGLQERGANLKADGRPIMGIHCDDLVKICKQADERIEVVPAHAWTPHFGLFGSLSGFDSVEEAFGDQAKYIRCLETGLSSDPKMNWQISALDRYSLTSNSDAHSLRKIGREANVFEMRPSAVSYDEVIRILYGKNPREFLYTIEFFPEEGKYHLDGHRECSFSCMPAETRSRKGMCPVCGKKLLVGVLSRVDALADREYGFIPDRSVPFKNVIPLEEVIAETLGVGVQSKKVTTLYEQMVNARHPGMDGSRADEFAILLDLPESQIEKIGTSEIARAVVGVREGRVSVEGGYDGVFGKIHIFGDGFLRRTSQKPKQMDLF